MKYKVVLEPSEEGFAVSVPGLPGCHSQGETESDALTNIADAIREYLVSGFPDEISGLHMRHPTADAVKENRNRS